MPASAPFLWRFLARLAAALLVMSPLSLTSLATAAPGAGQVLGVGEGECHKCHKNEVYVWKRTTHHENYEQLFEGKKYAKVEKIAKNMGVDPDRILNDSLCLKCHFLSREVGGRLRAVEDEGVSCESCHGPAKGWLKVHNDFGIADKSIKDFDKQMALETPAHKKQRLAKAKAAGMIRPAELYALASNCYGCHLVPEEKLVNVGGHPAGSKFELVAWSQGEVRHNFQTPPTDKNNPASAQRRRMLFLMGQALELETSLRGVGKATKKADYAVKMAKRAQSARKRLAKLAAMVKVPELGEMVKVAKGAKLKLNNGKALNAAADQVGAAARSMAANHDGSKLAALDPVLKKVKPKGKPAR